MGSKETAIYYTLITGLTALTILMALFVISIVGQQRRRNRDIRGQVIRDIGLIETERKRIAADLHDDLGAILAAARLGLENLEERLPDDPGLYQTMTQVDHSLLRLKEISHNLMPGILQSQGLGAAIAEYAEEIRINTRVRVSYEYHGADGHFNATKTILVFRVVQEILTNALKHAKASDIRIRYFQDSGKLNLMISDNGMGFDIQTRSHGPKQFGLKNIDSRLSLLEARYRFESIPGKGTSYQIKIPVLSMTEPHDIA